MKLESATYFAHVFHFDYLFFNFTLSLKKGINWLLIWVYKGSIVQNKKLRIKLKNKKKIIVPIHSDL
jgi:hypothetical protein